MADTPGIALMQRPVSLLQKRTASLIRDVRTAKDPDKIEKAARDFESILLGKWLDDAEKTFATVPGSDDDPDADPGRSQFQSLGMQQVASAIAANGGIGIARIIARSLHEQADESTDSRPTGNQRP